MNIGLFPNKFNFGEVSPLVQARVDLSKYQAGCKRLENFIPLLQGPITRRGGTRYIATAGNGANPVALLRFVKDEDETYIIELGNRYARFYRNGAPVMSGTSPYQITTPWTQAMLFDATGICQLKCAQSADVMYIVCPGTAPRKLNHFGHTNWTVTAVANWSPRPNPQAITLWRERLVMAAGNTLYMSQSGAFENFEVSASNVPGATGSWASDGNNQYYQSPMTLDATNGTLTYSFDNSSIYLATITIGWDPEEATGSFNNAAKTFRVTPRDPEKGMTRLGFVASGRYDDTHPVFDKVSANALSGKIEARGFSGYSNNFVTMQINPNKTSIFRDDSVTTSDGMTVGYIVRGAENAIAADDPIEIDVYSDTTDDVEWLIPSDKLLVGTTGSEFIVGEVTNADPFGPENCKVVPETSYGSAPLQPLRIGQSVIFVQRTGRKLREFVYDYAGDSFLALDLTVAAEHVTKGGLTSMAWQSEAVETLWAVRKDGQLIGFTYSKDQDMTAWHRHILGGGGQVSHLAVIPSAYGERDELWLSVKRVINGQTRYYIERLEPGHELGGNLADAFFVDSGRTVIGTNMTQVTGLAHLEGQEVHILADGGVQPPQVVTGGAVPLKYAANKVQVGLPFKSVMTTTNVEVALRDGTIQGRIKRFVSARLRLIESLGGAAGYDESNMDRIENRHGDNLMDAAVPLVTGDVKIMWPHGYEIEGQLTVAQDYPLPFLLAAIVAEMAVEGRE